jgi:serine phosphatase RsbU (regulator of sigma subunit)
MNARVHRDALVRERVSRDLVLAGEVVRSFLPKQLPEIPGFDFYASNESAQEVGGDYYDFIPLPDGRVGIVVGDVAGKGIAAALVMARFSAETRACLRTEPDLVSAVRRLNAQMMPLTLTDRFVTLAAFVLDPKTSTVTIVNAGHPPPMVLRSATNALEEVMPRDDIGPPIAVWEDYPYVAHEITLQPGDNIVLFSDGVTEAMDGQGRDLGLPGLRALLQKQNAPAHELGARVLQGVDKHAAGCPQHDDVTLVCFGRLA